MQTLFTLALAAVLLLAYALRPAPAFAVAPGVDYLPPGAWARRRALLPGAVILAIGVIVIVPLMALAVAEPDAAPVVVDNAGGQYVLTPFYWKVITSVVVPFIIAGINKANLNDKWKGAIGIITAAIAALIARWTTVGGDFVFDRAALEDIFHTYAMELLLYLGWYKKLDINGKILPKFGIGPATAGT